MSDGENLEEQSTLEAIHQETEDAKQLVGYRDISSLATWTLSSAKPGCALPQLRHPSTNLFWQSDGPQPHTLSLHFFKLVAIVKMRIYLDFDLDESYTPTKMKFFAGMSEGGLVEFGNWQVLETIDPMTGEAKSNIDGVRGWIDVPLKGVGGREARYHEIVEDEEDAMELDDERGRKTTKSRKDLASTDRGWPQADTDSEGAGDVLKAMIVQVQVCENHQNGKDTHVRGFQVFARDEAGLKDVRTKMKKQKHKPKSDKLAVEEDTQDGEEEELVGLQPAAWMGDPEVR